MKRNVFINYSYNYLKIFKDQCCPKRFIGTMNMGLL